MLGCILTLGALATLYTVLGGMKAVIWTDFVQFIVLAGGLVFMIVFLLSSLQWDASGVWQRAGELTGSVSGTPHTTLVDWSFDLGAEATVWSILFFLFFYNVGTLGTDQVIVQRYLTVDTFRGKAKAVMSGGIITIILVLALASLGLLLVVYYDKNPQLAAGITRPDMIVPHFVAYVLPVGVRGMILAALLAATMSSVDSALNSFATVGIMDLYRRWARDLSEAHLLRVGRLLHPGGRGPRHSRCAVLVSGMQSTVDRDSRQSWLRPS